MKSGFFLPTLLSTLLFASCHTVTSLDYVDPLIGTKGEGTQYGGMMPMAGVPFGSIQWVPMTRLTDVSRLSFNESDSLLLGFIGTRQPAIWMGEWGQVSFQPQLGEVDMNYSTRGQAIESYKYAPCLNEVSAGGIATRFAGLSHSAVYEFSAADHLVIDASRTPYHPRSNHAFQPGHIEFGEDCRSISGWNSDRFDGQHTSEKPNFKGYFYIELSRPFTDTFVKGDKEEEVQAYVSFADPGKSLTLRIGVSLISVEDAKANMQSELAGRGVDAVAAISRKLWQDKFDVLRIEASDEVKTIFYTGLYHALLYPRKIDENGRYYSAFDDSVHVGTMYSCWSMWDTYRAEHPLLTLVAPERIDPMMQSLLEMYREGGWLPKWPNPGYTGIMAGSPAETILAEAWTKGFRGFDLNLAYEAVKKNATVPQQNDTVFRWEDRGNFGDTPETRAGLTRYMQLGYVAGDETNESVSRTLDFGLQDRAAAVLAAAAGYPEDSLYFYERSFNYRLLWNKEAGWFLPRAKDGSWMDPEKGRHYTECKPWTAQWCVPYDVQGVAGLIGGEDRYEAALDDFFATKFWLPERGNKSIHGNEPSHHVAYLYNRISCPHKTQKTVREIMSRSYSTERKGFDGNEDCGQMSSWYILSSLGLYMLNPADGWYELGSPCVEEAWISFGKPYKNARLHIVAENQSPENVLVDRVTFNGKDLKDWRIHHSDLIKGGELRFRMKASE